jgi:PAS domain S-box-containing protein
MTSDVAQARILIVVDEALQAAGLLSRLEKLGYNVCGHAADNALVLDLVEQHQPDLILMDIACKGLVDRLVTAKAVRDEWGVPVVLLVAHKDMDRLEHAWPAYPFGIIEKPFRDRDLTNAIKSARYVAGVEADRRRTEDRLNESEEKYRLLFTHAPAGIYEVDFTTGLFTRVNALMCEYTGYTEEKLLSMGALNILTEESQIRFLERFERINRGEDVSQNVDYCIKNKDGSTKWVQINNQFIYKNKNITGATVIAHDITARKQAEEAIKKSEEKYRNLVEKLDDIIWSLDLDLRTIYISPSIEKTLGFTPEERIEMRFEDQMTPASFARASELFALELAKEHEGDADPDRTVRAAFEYYHKNGSTLWFENMISGLRDENGTLIGLQGVSRDITAYKLAQETLHASEHRHRKLLENIPDIVLRFDRDCRHLYAGPMVKKVVDLKPEDFFGKTHRELGFSEPLCEYWETRIQRVFETETAMNEEFEFDGVSGRTYFDWRLVPEYGIDGRIESVLSISRDVSDRKRIESDLVKNRKTLQKIFEILPVGLWFADKNGKLISGNPKGVEIWGAEPRVGREEYSVFRARRLPSREEIHPDDWALAHTINKGLTIENELIEIDAFDGKTKTVLNFTAPVKDDDGQVLGAIVVNQDVTEFMQIENELKKSLQEKETLLKELHHRVKNNMQVIISLINMQTDRLDDEQAQIACQETKNRIYAMAAVHESLHRSENLSVVNLGEYLTRLSDTIFYTYRTDSDLVRIRTGIDEINVNLEKSYPIGLVINELISNALKYAFPDGRSGEIMISGEHVHNTATLIVTDNGVGMPANVDWRTSGSLGLQIVQALVEDQLGGAIALDKADGTRWTITFPL